MNVEEVRELVRAQIADRLAAVNDHRITLKQTLVPPKRISVIARMVQEIGEGRLTHETHIGFPYVLNSGTRHSITRPIWPAGEFASMVT